LRVVPPRLLLQRDELVLVRAAPKRSEVSQ
jgi:hypothetical protein